MDRISLNNAFVKLAAILKKNLPQEQVNIYLTGSAAALLSGEMEREAKDCDIVSYEPTSIQNEIESACNEVASKLELDNEWLNVEAYIFAEYLPADWKSRTKVIMQHANLKVYSLSRQDLIVAKAFGIQASGDDKHRNDLNSMRPTVSEIDLAIDAIKTKGDKLKEDFQSLVAELEKLRNELQRTIIGKHSDDYPRPHLHPGTN
jgi:hypothetical protein